MYNDFGSGTPFDVAVIGAGASGTLVAAQFEKLAPFHARLVLIGAQPKPARGLAYDTPNSTNLLNVPAGNMSAFPDDPEHFTRWLAKHISDSSDVTFAPRRVYGDYLLNIFMKLRKYSSKVDYLNNEVMQLTREDQLWQLYLENGNVISARCVVLALGNLLLPDDPIDFGPVKSHYYRNPWSSVVAQDLPAQAPVLLIGTGLTMVDVALSLRESGHRGIIHAISRHGRLPQPHQACDPRPLNRIPEDFESPVSALHWIRTEIEKEMQIGHNWRAVIDSLRPHTSYIWQRWDVRKRKSFMRHARTLWDIHRHRMAPENYEQLRLLIESERLMIHQGLLISARAEMNHVSILWKNRKIKEARLLNVARIINCTGPSRDLTKARSPLVSKFLASGWITVDSLKLGLETDREGRVLDKNGNAAPGLYTLGPLRIAELWESVSIPEIRGQAAELTQLLIKENQGAKQETYERTH